LVRKYRKLSFGSDATAYTEHSLESFKYEVIDYLVKPISLIGFYRQSIKHID